MSKTVDFRNINLPLDERVKALVSSLTLDEKVESMMQYQPAITRLGVAAYKHGTEAAHGMAWLGKATSFPQPIGLGCTWDTALLKQIGDVIGDEARIFYEQNREVHGLTLWAPTVDMERDPRWGRTEESYGEDPVLTGELTAALVQGIQGDHPKYYKAIATLKHFIGNNNEINRGSCSVTIDPRNMKEYYQAAFKLPFVKGGAKSMMTSYNAVNGTPTILLEDVKRVVKEEWNLDGFIVSDAGDLLGIVNDHHYYETYKEAVAHAVKAGIDSITDDKEKTVPAIYEALNEGLLTEEDINLALFNTFKVRFLLGEFDPSELNPYNAIPETKLMAPEHGMLAREAAKKSIVLLKNDKQLLPIKETVSQIAVLGPLADVVYRDWYSGTFPYEVSIAEGIKHVVQPDKVKIHDARSKVKLYDKSKKWAVHIADDEHQSLYFSETDGETFLLTDWDHSSYTLQREVNNKFVTSALDSHLTSHADEAFGWFVKEIIRINQEDECIKLHTWNNQLVKHFGATNSALEIVKEPNETDLQHSLFSLDVIEDGLEAAVALAKQSEVAVVVVGNHPLINGKEEIDRPSLRLPAAQQQLIKRVHEVNANTVVVIVGSYPYILDDIKDYCGAIVYLAHAGQEQGHAVAEMLFGRYSPAGRLNMTWYAHESQLTSIMDYDIRKTKRTYQYVDTQVDYPFGHGLTYASFTYSDLSLITTEQGGYAQLSLTNQSSFAAEEVVQLYASVDESKVPRPRKKLIGFKRVAVPAQSTLTVQIPFDQHQLEVWDVANEYFVFEQATYQFLIGRSAEQIELQASLQLGNYTFIPRLLTEWTKAETFNDYESIELDESKEGITCVRAKKGLGHITFTPLQPNHPTKLLARICGGKIGGMLIVKSNDVIVGSTHLVPSEEQQWKLVTIELKSVEDVLTFELTGSIKLSKFMLTKGE